MLVFPLPVTPERRQTPPFSALCICFRITFRAASCSPFSFGSGSSSSLSGAARRSTSVWNSSMICFASSVFSVALPAPVNCRRSRLDSTSKLQSRSTSSACFGAFVRFASTKAAASSVATARRTISRVLSRVLCRPARSNHSPAGSITRTAS